MKVAAIKCPRCKDTIYSRARHDMRSCSCRAIHIDGGVDEDYVKISYDPSLDEVPKVFYLEIEVTKNVLYDDWNRGINNYGLIKENLSC